MPGNVRGLRTSDFFDTAGGLELSHSKYETRSGGKTILTNDDVSGEAVDVDE